MAIVQVGTIRLQVERQVSRRAFVEQLIEQMEAQVCQLVGRCIEEVLAAEVTALLGRGWYVRCRRGTERVAAQCNRCRSRDPSAFRRDGSYQRWLDTRWGRVRIRVPQVECRCGGYVRVPFQTLLPRQRVWDDLASEIRERYAGGMSLRSIKARLDARLRSSVGLRTLNKRVRQVGSLVPGWQMQPVGDVPPVVSVDGLWVTLMQPTGEVKPDRLGRVRSVKRAQKVPLLVAQGIWPAVGRRQIVAWVIGAAEDAASWQALLTQMWQRGITPERGFRLLIGDGSAGLEKARRFVYWDVAFQRCIFHKLRNIWRDIVPPEELTSRHVRVYKRRFIRAAARIWQAPSERAARQRRQHFCQTWAAHQPQAIATLARDFDLTLTFYQIQAAQPEASWPARLLRTTSPLERELRAYRWRIRGAVLLHSPSGLAALVHQTCIQRTCHASRLLPTAWLLELERALANACQIS
jgi:putative transposase